MTIDNDSQQRQAAARIQIAIERLAMKYFFHARVLEQLRCAASPQIATMGVGFSETDRELLLCFNPAFVNRILLSELVGVVLHEVHHVVFGHIYRDPRLYPDHWAQVVAQEVTVNEYVHEPLPGMPIKLEMFPALSPKQSTDVRYNILKKQTKRNGLELSLGAHSSASSWSLPHLSDDHSLWPHDPTDAENVRSLVQELLEAALASCTQKQTPNYIAETLSHQGVGCCTAANNYTLRHGGSGQIPWQHVLRRYFGRLLAPDYALHYPNRRLPALLGIVPGKIRLTGKPKIMAVIDTSASISEPMLESIDAELARMARLYSITVVECDCRIHKVFPYAPLEKLTGRGGTDLRPPFHKRFLLKHAPDLIIYFTDGYGPAPKQAPRQPVIWCLLPGGVTPAKWGTFIKMKMEK